MSTSAVLNNAARILKLVQTGTPADQALRDSLTQDRHFTAPAERRGISRAVFTYFRWWRWLGERDSLQKQLTAALELQARFDKNPAGFKTEALAARAVPDWLKAEMDDIPPSWLPQLQRDPPLWIRAKAGTGVELVKKLSHFTPAPQSADALRYSGLTDLYRTKEFQAGEFEIQDLASQLVSLACAPQPGETWWDACAGEGGKTMHLSDLMQNKGLIWASDRSLRRLAKLKERAARAKVFNFRAAPWEGDAKLPTKTKFDGILIDAPCTGVGTWQRNPHARWTTTPKDVGELAAVQAKLLSNVAGSLKPGGRLVYSVCTLTRAETTGVATAFTAAHPELAPVSAQTLWPHELDANGMFIATWRRK
ncbi:MAG: RsmB/NOP family class I SAM-dependent RNA methyltransferase [bacterium]|nr:RsmB/NOP family class I SAM-dependent RNA methyltransferase [bacterium]MDI1336793.1 RsmB/NOP family class I SAM-dependent RNA methyltransferase [Lacunisphaera sp.]